jgi:hypothetical protein
MSPRRFDINQDFSWVFFGCLVVVLIVFGLGLTLARLMG